MVATSNAVNLAYYIAGQTQSAVPLGEGMPGIGKTEGVRALARATGRHFSHLLLDQCLPEDLGGFPVIRQQTATDGRVFDAMAKILDERLRCRMEPSILLVDELTNCPHTTQAAALQLIAEGIPNCWIFAACNPVHQAAAGVDITPPMINRMCLLPFETDRAAIFSGWRNGLHFPAPAVPILPDDWRDNRKHWGQLVAAFIERKPDLLEQFPRDPAQASQPFPSPRAWTNAINLCAANESVGNNPATRAQLVNGTVGHAACNVFLHWLEEQGLPDPEFLLANPSRLALARRGDLALATLASVCNAVKTTNTPDRWEALCDVIENAYGQNQECTIARLGQVWAIKPANHAPAPATADGRK